ncbi:Spb1 C-terminal domain-containing protein [Gautieria morchelliformis]|nr:Spb1 C-terminal domain-containing protein [Gautieria morchelliformis]
MGKTQKKTGKNRLDKYYKLAKEQGYRARSAFKLIQLNKKYSFLESARCCIDLCAAPGGWLQVASKYMPVNSVIVGVDLVPIKPIPKVSTFAADITTPQCRNLIRGELKDWRADIVLHDGAPNVGTAWVQDAYGQSELVLMSLKLAVEFLVKGGTFVTKVFRSVDYNNLMWVFNQLFDKVEATKPPSSRNVSAEIFVVCRGFMAPKHIDPRFLDPKHVFKDLTMTAAAVDKGASANNVQANRDGYDDGDYTLFKTAGAAEFIAGTDAIGLLGTVNKITFQTEQEKEWLALDATTPEIKAVCQDLKVLGKGDFKALLKWRTAIREETGLDVKTKNVDDMTEVVEITEEPDEQQVIEEELQRINAEAAARAKRERRRANEVKTRTIQRMQLRMTAPLDIGLDLEDKGLDMGQEDIFDLETEESTQRKSKISRTTTDLMDDEDEDSADEAEELETDHEMSEEERKERRVHALEQELDGLYDSYRERKSERDAKFKVKEARKQNKERDGEWAGFDARASDEDTDEGEESEEGGWEKTAEAKARDGEDSSDVESDEDPKPVTKKRQRVDSAESPTHNKRAKLVTKLSDPQSAGHLSKTAQVWFEQDMFKELGDINVPSDQLPAGMTGDSENTGSEASAEVEGTGPAVSDAGDDDFEIVPQDPQDDVEMWDVADENEDEIKQATIKKFGLVTPEAVTLAQQLVNREKTKTQLIDEGFNRYSFNSRDGLPSWFLDDESKHYKTNLPVTKEAVAALRAKQRALDARPIKKVAEAKARKKHRATLRLEKAMKKAEGVNETTDMSEREKASQIEKLMRKGISSGKGKQTKSQVKIVVAKGAHKGLKGRPKGVKGRYTMVDARMKKEVRAQKRKEKANKKRKRA